MKYFLASFKSYRKWKGGTWYLHRHWFDLGRGMITWWSRTCLGYKGGNLCTIDEENYEKN